MQNALKYRTKLSLIFLFQIIFNKCWFHIRFGTEYGNGYGNGYECGNGCGNGCGN